MTNVLRYGVVPLQKPVVHLRSIQALEIAEERLATAVCDADAGPLPQAAQGFVAVYSAYPEVRAHAYLGAVRIGSPPLLHAFTELDMAGAHTSRISRRFRTPFGLGRRSPVGAVAMKDAARGLSPSGGRASAYISATGQWAARDVGRSMAAGRTTVSFTLPDHYAQCAGGRTLTADLIRCREKWYRHVSVERPVAENGPTVGVDLGRPAVLSKSPFFGRRPWRGAEARSFRLCRSLPRSGTRSAQQHLRRLARKVNRFRRDCGHVRRRCIVDSVEPGTVIIVATPLGITAVLKASSPVSPVAFTAPHTATVPGTSPSSALPRWLYTTSASRRPPA